MTKEIARKRAPKIEYSEKGLRNIRVFSFFSTSFFVFVFFVLLFVVLGVSCSSFLRSCVIYFVFPSLFLCFLVLPFVVRLFPRFSVYFLVFPFVFFLPSCLMLPCSLTIVCVFAPLPAVVCVFSCFPVLYSCIILLSLPPFVFTLPSVVIIFVVLFTAVVRKSGE